MKIAVLGANGRMGGSLIRLLMAGQPGLELGAAVTEAGDECVGRDAGLVAGAGPAGIEVTDALENAVADCDVVIDFTSPAALERHLSACGRSVRPLVVGTTGLAERQEAALEAAAGKLPIVYGRNMSPGIAVLTELAGQVARMLGDDYDIEITDVHHRYKQDAPSGTALQLGEAVAAARGVDLAQVASLGRHGRESARRPGEIGFSALRAGHVVGEHRILFAGPEELIELRHEGLDRALFARGALRAAAWLAGKSPGLYSMRDVLGTGSAHA